jgi:soluble P-type ATPase
MAIDLRLEEEDPFEKVLLEIVSLQRNKAQDYAADGDTLKNMREVVQMLGIKEYTVVEDCNAMVHRKSARINNLRGRSARNESVRDSYVDRAVYAILAIVALDEETPE